MFRNRSGITAKMMGGMLAITIIIAQTPAAQADEGMPGWDIPREAVALGVLVLLGEGYLLVSGSVVAVGNGVYAANGEQSTPGWRNQGYVLGSLNIIIGGIMIGSAIINHKEDLGILGAVHTGVGLADLGLTIWSQVQTDGNRRRVTVSPLLIPSREGPPAVGVGVQLFGW